MTFPLFRFSIMSCAVLWLANCTYVPFEVPKTESHYIAEVGSTKLTRSVEKIPPARSNASATILPDGHDALSARLRIIENAEKTVDLQYFLIKEDYAGGIISAAIIRAAKRGVRVRFLIDDVFTSADEAQLRYLDSLDNIEVRYFNPLSRNSIKPINYLFDFNRVNRRMHNKSLTADGVIAILGGRNIADEYYGIDNSHSFADFDVMLTGSAVDDIGQQFDVYWNDRFTVPATTLLGQPDPESVGAAQASISEREQKAASDIYRQAVQSDYLDEVIKGTQRPYSGNADFVFDTPQKLRETTRSDDFSEMPTALIREMRAAKQEVVLLTPYFVPQNWGEALFKELAESGIRVRIITNSLEANNHAYVHGGYYSRREPLLKSGVELYEIRSDAPSILAGKEEAEITMHTKLAVIDGRKVFIGSLNFDPRSIRINTEHGVFFDSPELGRNLNRFFDQALNDYAYKVTLNEQNKLQWIYSGKPPVEINDSEPAGFFKQLIAIITNILPVEGQL